MYKDPARILDELRKVVGAENVLFSPEDIYCYSFDASIYSAKPSVVIRPHSTREVAEVVKLANQEKIPITPRGGGTNFAGGAIPINGGIVVDLTGMSKILEISRSNLRCIVEAGVVHADLENRLAEYGLFWPPDPGSSESCTIGGVLATNVGGMRALKYGTTRDWVLGLKVVLPTGDIISTGSYTHKSNVGYDLTRLFIGSEGTLGIITEAILKVHPLPEAVLRMSATLHELERVRAVITKIFDIGILPTMIELMDRNIIRAINKWLGLGVPESEVYVIIDIDGEEEEIEKYAKRVESLLVEEDANNIQYSTEKEIIERIYTIRREAATALPKVTGKTNVTLDFCVPIDKLPESIKEVHRIARKWDLVVSILAHAGDGNVHPIFSIDINDPDEIKRFMMCKVEIYKMSLQLGGTISGEHGIGIDKADLIEKEHGEKALEIMRSIKRIFDPNNIMNPGKMGL